MLLPINSITLSIAVTVLAIHDIRCVDHYSFYNERKRRLELLDVLEMAGVEVEALSSNTEIDGKKISKGSPIISLAQPYGMFAKAMLEKGGYPNLLDEKGEPIRPYDVTAHSLSQLMGVEAIPISRNINTMDFRRRFEIVATIDASPFNDGIYRSYIPSKDEGWTRWIVLEKASRLDIGSWNYTEIKNKYINDGDFSGLGSITFPDQSASQILNGYREGRMPKEYTGGLKGKGVENLKKFVENGGTLVFMNRSSDFAIEQFNLPVKNISKGWKRKDFFIPGSILRTELDTSHPVANGMPEKSIAWFERSPVFESTDDSRVKVIGKYPSDPKEILLSGWALGKEKIAGKAALVEVKMGKGKVILFGFRPQYRGQSLATFPLLFNSIKN